MTLPPADPRALLGIGRRFLRARDPATRAIRALRADYYRESWMGAAAAIDGSAVDLGDGRVRVDRGGRSVVVFEQHTPFNDTASDRVARDKPLVRELLEGVGIPTPRQRLVRRSSDAIEFAETTGWPVVVKPARGTGAGAGVTTNVGSQSRLRRAVRWAAAFGSDVIVEEQAAGHVHRLLFLDGVLLDGIIRHPPTVVGDGVSTIRTLIEGENQLRIEPGSRRAQSLIGIDMDARASLEARGLSLSTVPDPGDVVVVKAVVNENRADENEGVAPAIHPSVRSLGRTASDLTGARLVGVDVIAPTLEVALAESGGCVLELNTPPGHFYHHMRPEGFDVARCLLEHLFGVA